MAQRRWFCMCIKRCRRAMRGTSCLPHQRLIHCRAHQSHQYTRATCAAPSHCVATTTPPDTLLPRPLPPLLPFLPFLTPLSRESPHSHPKSPQTPPRPPSPHPHPPQPQAPTAPRSNRRDRDPPSPPPNQPPSSLSTQATPPAYDASARRQPYSPKTSSLGQIRRIGENTREGSCEHSSFRPSIVSDQGEGARRIV